jgi:hypothetical protein
VTNASDFLEPNNRRGDARRITGETVMRYDEFYFPFCIHKFPKTSSTFGVSITGRDRQTVSPIPIFMGNVMMFDGTVLR